MTTTNKNSVSRTICNNSIDYIKHLLDTTTNTNTKNKNKNKTHYINYEHTITQLVNTFLTTQLQLITKLFSIKNNLSFILTYTKEKLNSDSDTTLPYSIPSFIDIFRYLITINEFISQFTLDEQKKLKDNLNNTKTKKECYLFLNKVQLGTKLLKIYNQFIYSYPSIYDTLLKLYPSLEFHSLLINNFTSYTLLEEIELNIKHLIKYSIVWKGKTYPNIVYVFMYDDDNNNNDDNDDDNNNNNDDHNNNNNNNTMPSDYLHNLGTDIIKRLLFFNEFLTTTHLPDRFILFLTDKKKEIDKDLIENYHFKTSHVNTAVTNSRDIIIYRKEELFKSIFHEAIHFHQLDFRNLSSPNAISTLNYFTKTHHINTDNTYLLYEAITETLANVLNSLYYSRDINEMKLTLKNEIIFSTLQVSKVLHLGNYTTWNEFSFSKSTKITKYNSKHISKHKKNKTNNTYNKKNKIKFKQDSCVFSYYIVKLYLLLNLSLYFKTNLDKQLKFISTEKSFKQLIELIDVSRNNLVLKQFINSLLQGMNKKLTKTNLTKYNTIKKTMRMTCNENQSML